MLNAIQQGIFTASTKQRLEELEKQKEELSLSMTTAELQKPKLTREYMEHWFSQFRYGDPNDREFQKRLIDTFVNAIFVYDDKLVLTYNYQHGTQTITLKEVEDFLGSDLVGLSPPNKVVDFDRKSTTFFLCKKPLISRVFEPSPYKTARPGVNFRDGFFLFSAVAADCRISKGLLCGVFVCFLRIGLLYGVIVCFVRFYVQQITYNEEKHRSVLNLV